jgi:hypothetical protein
VSTLDVDTGWLTISSPGGLEMLVKRADRATVVFVGENPHWISEPSRLLAQLTIALSERSPVGLLAIELPYSMTPWLDRYVSVADDEEAAGILSELGACSLFASNSSYEELLRALRDYNKAHPDSLVHVGGWDVELYDDWLSYVYQNSTPDYWSHIENNVKIGGSANAASLAGDWDWRRDEASRTNLFDEAYLPRYRGSGRLVVAGGTAHTETKDGCIPQMEGCATARQYDGTTNVFSVEMRVLRADLSEWDPAAVSCGEARGDGRLRAHRTLGLELTDDRPLLVPSARRLTGLLSLEGEEGWWWLPELVHLHRHDELVVIKRGSFSAPRCPNPLPEKRLPDNLPSLGINVFLSHRELFETSLTLSGGQDHAGAILGDSGLQVSIRRWFEGDELRVTVEVSDQKSGEILVAPTFDQHLRQYTSYFSNTLPKRQAVKLQIIQLPAP